MSATAEREPAPAARPARAARGAVRPGQRAGRCARGCVSPRLGARAVAGDGVLGATGSRRRAADRLLRRRTAPTSAARSGERHADTIVRVLETRRAGADPGGRHSSSPAAPGCRRARRRSAGYGRIFRQTVALTGVVPQISVVSGASAGGGAYSPALTDLIVMTEDAAMFLTGPGVVREALGEEIDAVALGGPRVHERNGVCHLVEHDERSAAARVRELLSYLPVGGRRCRCRGRSPA